MASSRVAAVFPTRWAGKAAVARLIDKDFSAEQVRLTSSPQDESDAWLAFARAGAAEGGSMGGVSVRAVAGLLFGIGLIPIPGLAALFAAGPIPASLAGIVVGAIAGGLAGNVVGTLAAQVIYQRPLSLRYVALGPEAVVVFVDGEKREIETAAAMLRQPGLRKCSGKALGHCLCDGCGPTAVNHRRPPVDVWSTWKGRRRDRY